ncbi:MAG TPA: hypothetical protein DDX39_11535 [Bacteroidales bacterium]|nr:MAG: hypothetical protein A2W98_14130 [Bacteroidetes bacterium GWF2_33_38]OFY76511.1 MAG: hypothetical protein A2265_09805 [Bacteroidetes bacterium RIFOXYA12_FULL_33_9]OFY87042.1 MAG: hypothetical protein A2236_00105 [Bacteroidetes bacterium RIFOXYA2_FULL_33_7]HBF89262.1 hypothetical protein [Bacteroidales bacterium]
MRKIIILALFNALFLSVFAQESTKVDPRALKHYEVSKIDEMPESKIKKINFLFQESFIVEESSKAFIDKNTFDVYPYTMFRKERERVRVNIAFLDERRIEGQVDAFIILLSHQETDAAYKSILNENN